MISFCGQLCNQTDVVISTIKTILRFLDYQQVGGRNNIPSSYRFGTDNLLRPLEGIITTVPYTGETVNLRYCKQVYSQSQIL